MLCSIEDLRTAFDPDVLDDAQCSLDNGVVTAPNVSRNGRLITSLIERPGKRAHRVYVRVDVRRGESAVIRGECSCSRRSNCEHVAAVLLRALADEQDLSGEELDQALLATAPSATTENEYPPNVRQRLLYLLFPESGTGKGISVATVSAGKLKLGGFGGRRDYIPGWAARGTPPRFLLSVDRQLLAALDRLEPDLVAGMRHLHGQPGGNLLKRMLETGRCFLGDTEIALRPGAPRRALFAWGTDDQGNQYPVFQTDPHARCVFLLESVWYIDAGSGECGPLQSDLPATLLDALFERPSIAPEQVGDFHRELSNRYPGIDLPPLRAFEVKDLTAVRPVPCLRLRTVPIDDAEVGEIDVALLSFDYGGICLSGRQPSHVVEGDRLLRISRDENFEEACVEALMAAGLKWNDLWDITAGMESFFFEGAPEAWFDFQVDVLPRLRQQRWRIEFDESFRYRLAAVEQWYGQVESTEGGEWFHAGLGVQVDGERINLLPALVALLQDFPREFRRERLRELDPQRQLIVRLEDGQMVAVPLGRVCQILDTLFELYQAEALDTNGHLRLNRIQLARLAELDGGDEQRSVHWLGGLELHSLAERLRGIHGIPAVTPPRGLKGQLRDYQREGLTWLQFLRQHELAGVLADDMGLGKTVQTLTHLLLEKEQGRMERPSLVVAPTSLMVNWRREARQFAPDLRVLTLHGPQRRKHFHAIPTYDLVLTTYPLLARDQEILLQHRYHVLILDEAQNIKNPKTRASRLVRELSVRHRLCLTGTPLENHLGELWSLFDFLLPGLLGNDRQFRRVVRNPIEKQGDAEAAERLARRLRPFMLRRTKQEVVSELPPKTEIVRSVELEGPQRELYESIRLAMHERVRQEVADKGWARSQIVVLDALLKLRQVCCDPRLLKLESARKVRHSAKLEMLMELLPEMVEEGRRVLLFSQFTGMLKLIEDAVRNVGIDYVKLTGRTRNRATPVERFQRREVPLFLISLKAGGVGLNLTAADTVIHYDPWWNPAVERQATDRAHRIGQGNPVFVYKLISEGTVEEKIQAMQVRKQVLADNLFDRSGGSELRWTDEDLDGLFEPLSPAGS